MPVASHAQTEIQSCLASVVQAGTIPGLAFYAVGRDGKYLVESNSGVDSADPIVAMPIDSNSIFWIASSTKLITGIACLQLHEQHNLDLDSPDVLYNVCPELKTKQVLVDGGALESRKSDITLRKLLNHTSGLAYTLFNQQLHNYASATGLTEFVEHGVLNLPLASQPGTRWEYGTSLDWVGIFIMRFTGMSLDRYFQQNICSPLGLENISLFPRKHMLGHLVDVQFVGADGTLQDMPHPLLTYVSLTQEEEDKAWNSGGGGGLASPRDFCQILATLLNNGTSPTTGKQILKPETVELMFENSIPQLPDFARSPTPSIAPFWSDPVPQWYDEEGDPPQGWGLSFMLTGNGGGAGRGRNTAWWFGMTNLFWWCDREKGVAGIFAAQKLPRGDAKLMQAYRDCEAAVYAGLS